MKKMKIGISVGAVVVAGLAMTPTLGAQAAWSDCPSAKVCLWQNNDYSGDFLGWRSAGGGLLDISPVNDNRTSSWGNRSTTNAAFYQLAGGEGFCVPMPATSQNPDLADAFNDKASSWRTNRGC